MNEKENSAPSRSAVAAQFFNSLHRYKNVLLSKWWVLFLCVGMGVSVSLSLKWNAPAEYQSASRMIVGAKTSLANSGATEEMNNYYGTQQALMQSEVVSNKAVLTVMESNSTVRPCPVSITVTVSPKTSIFNLRVIGTNGEYARLFLDALMDNYIDVKKDMRKTVVGTSKEAVQGEVDRVRAQVQASKQAQLGYESSNSVVFLQDQGNQAADYLARLTREQAGLKSELQLLKVLALDENVERQAVGLQQATGVVNDTTPSVSQMKAGGEVGVASDDINQTDGSSKNSNLSPELVASQSEYLKTKQQIALLKSQKSELSEFLRPKHPKIVQLDEEIGRKEKLLDVYRDQSQEQLRNFIHSLELQVANLDSQLLEWEGKALEISRRMSEYQDIKQETVRLQNTVDRLSTLSFSIDSDRNTTQENVAVLEKAGKPALRPNQLPRLIVLAAAVGLILGLSILVVLDRLDDRPTSFGELQEIIDEEVLGQIPMVRTKDKTSPGVIEENDNRHALVEAYRNLRSSIAFLGTPDKHPKTLLITSAIPSDGKSMTSANLAITLARSGSRVLLVDADLRRGVMHTRFNTRNSPGFSEVLAGQAAWRDALVPTQTPNLTLLPRGSTKRHPGELFVMNSKDAILKEIITQYDFILFDTAPVMAADDVSNLAPYVDGVIMVIRANYTSGRVARAAMDLLYQRKTNLLGVVFNAVRSHSSEYYYYHYKDYYAKNTTK